MFNKINASKVTKLTLTDSEGIEPPSLVLETKIIPLYEEPKMISSWNALATTFHSPQSNPQPDYLFNDSTTLFRLLNLKDIHMTYVRSVWQGRCGIRTHAPFYRPDGFQDRSLKPDLGNLPILRVWRVITNSDLSFKFLKIFFTLLTERVGFEPTHAFKRLTI